MKAIPSRACAYLFVSLLCGCASAADIGRDQALDAIKNELVAQTCEGIQPSMQRTESKKYMSYYAELVTKCDGMPHAEYTLRGFVFDKLSMARLGESEILGRDELEKALGSLRALQVARANSLGFACEIESSSGREIYVNEHDEPVVLLNYPYPNQACSLAYNLVTERASYPFE